MSSEGPWPWPSTAPRPQSSNSRQGHLRTIGTDLIASLHPADDSDAGYTSKVSLPQLLRAARLTARPGEHGEAPSAPSATRCRRNRRKGLSQPLRRKRFNPAVDLGALDVTIPHVLQLPSCKAAGYSGARRWSTRLGGTWEGGTPSSRNSWLPSSRRSPSRGVRGSPTGFLLPDHFGGCQPSYPKPSNTLRRAKPDLETSIDSHSLHSKGQCDNPHGFSSSRHQVPEAATSQSITAGQPSRVG